MLPPPLLLLHNELVSRSVGRVRDLKLAWSLCRVIVGYFTYLSFATYDECFFSIHRLSVSKYLAEKF
jgi:hypothetical protein